ncbi:hypothetical protein [Endozoicomonas lisbonensis]
MTLSVLAALPSIVMAVCDNCNTNTYCQCKEADALYQSLSTVPQNSGQSNTSHERVSNVEADGPVWITTSRGTFTIGNENSPDPQIFYDGHNLYYQLNRQAPHLPVLSGPASMPTAPAQGSNNFFSIPTLPRHHGRGGMFSLWTAGRDSNLVSEQSDPRAGYAENRHLPAPIANRRVFRDADYHRYTGVNWEAIHEQFAEAQRRVRELDERNKVMKEIYEKAVSRDVLDNTVGSHPPPYSAEAARRLMEDFQNNIQITLGNIARESNLTSLVFPAETTHSLEWIRGNFEFVYTALLKALLSRPRESAADFFQHSMQIRQQVLRFSQSNQVAANIPHYNISQSSGNQGIQRISDQLVDYINSELRNGVRSFAFRYSGIPSPYNQGSLFLFIFQDVTILISPHLGVLMSRNIDDTVNYIVDYTLALAVGRISEKIHISRL